MIDPDYFEKMYTTKQPPMPFQPIQQLPESPEFKKLHYVDFDNFKDPKRIENLENPAESKHFDLPGESKNLQFQKEPESELLIPMNTDSDITYRKDLIISTPSSQIYTSSNSNNRIKTITRDFLFGRIPRVCMILILLLSLITNVIILHWKMTVSTALATDFTNFPCNSYTFITTTVFITVILSFIVIYSFASNRSMDERIWIKPLIFTFLLIWILSPSLILLYIRKNCDSENIENYIIVNAWINVFVSGILILWFFISWNDFSNRIKIFFRGSNK